MCLPRFSRSPSSRSSCSRSCLSVSRCSSEDGRHPVGFSLEKGLGRGLGSGRAGGERMKIPPARRLPGCRRIHGSILQARTAAGGTAGQGPGACREPRARILGELEFPWERCPEGALAFFLAHCIEEVYLMTGSGSRFRSLRNPGRDGPPRIAALGGHKPGERCLFQLRFSRVLCKRRRQNRGSVGFVLPVGNRAVRAFPPAFFPQFSQFIPAEINHAPNPAVACPSCHPPRSPWDFLGKRNGWDGRRSQTSPWDSGNGVLDRGMG